MAAVVTAMVLVLAAHTAIDHAGLMRLLLRGAEASGGRPNYVRNILELTSFAATTLLFLTALAALWFTVAQISEAQRSRIEAEKTRIANLYLQITALWSDEKAVSSRMWVLETRDKFNANYPDDAIRQASASVQEYLRRTIEEERTRDRQTAQNHVYILTLLENLGVLCERGYVSTDDILDFIASPIRLQMDLLADYVDAQQRFGPSVYINARRLHQAAVQFLQEYKSTRTL